MELFRSWAKLIRICQNSVVVGLLNIFTTYCHEMKLSFRASSNNSQLPTWFVCFPLQLQQTQTVRAIERKSQQRDLPFSLNLRPPFQTTCSLGQLVNICFWIKFSLMTLVTTLWRERSNVWEWKVNELKIIYLSSGSLENWWPKLCGGGLSSHQGHRRSLAATSRKMTGGWEYFVGEAGA